ncbi:hypothetical protein EOK76_g2693 [Lacticaseibacillus paracasei]|nr:hypothetical protein EOK76_g2693 [Lacticaseibacillus paracasei]
MLMADGFIIRSEDDVKKYEYCFIKKVALRQLVLKNKFII